MKNIEIVNADLTKISKSAEKAGDGIDNLGKSMDNLSDSAKQADISLKDFSSDNFELLETMENATRVTAGFVGAVEVAQGTLHLMGVDNEFVNKSLEDMMALMQVSQGLTDMADGIKSFKMLKEMIAASTAATAANTAAVTANATATTGAAVATTGFGKALNMCKGAFAGLTKIIKANPYAALATAILAAVTAIGAFAKKSNDAAKQQKLLEEAQRKVIDATKKNTKEAEHAYRLLKAQGVEEDKALKRKIKLLEAEEARLRLRKIELQQAQAEGANITQEMMDEINNEISAIVDNIDSLYKDLEIFNVQSKTDAVNAAKEAAQARIDAEKAANEKIAEERRAAQEELNDELHNLSKEITDANKSDFEKELNDVTDHYTELLKKYKSYLEQKKITEKQYADIEVKIYERMSQEKYAIYDKYEKLAQEKAQKFLKDELNSLNNLRQALYTEARNDLDANLSKSQAESDKFSIIGKDFEAAEKNKEGLITYFNGLNQALVNFVGNIQPVNNIYDGLQEIIDTAQKIRNAGNAGLIIDKDEITEATEMAIKYYDTVSEKSQNHLMELFKMRQLALSGDKKDLMFFYNGKGYDKGEFLDTYNEQVSKFIENINIATGEKGVLKQFLNEILNIGNEIKDSELLSEFSKIDNKFSVWEENASILSNKFSELQQLSAGWGPGEGMSDKWGSVFGSIQTGIENVKNGFKDAAKETDKAGKSWKKYGTLAVAGLSVASNMMQAIADEQDATSEEGFERQKKWQIGAATMSMLGGIVDAWASAFKPSNELKFTWQKVAMGSAMSAMILATGLMQINKIKQTKFGGDSGVDGTQATPAIGALESMQNGMQYTNIIEGASTEGQIEDTRVYVVESDITNTQNKVKVAQNEATF